LDEKANFGFLANLSTVWDIDINNSRFARRNICEVTEKRHTQLRALWLIVRRSLSADDSFI